MVLYTCSFSKVLRGSVYIYVLVKRYFPTQSKYRAFFSPPYGLFLLIAYLWAQTFWIIFHSILGVFRLISYLPGSPIQHVSIACVTIWFGHIALPMPTLRGNKNQAVIFTFFPAAGISSSKVYPCSLDGVRKCLPVETKCLNPLFCGI